jgi:hypothetical protein
LYRISWSWGSANPCQLRLGRLGMCGHRATPGQSTLQLLLRLLRLGMGVGAVFGDDEGVQACSKACLGPLVIRSRQGRYSVRDVLRRMNEFFSPPFFTFSPQSIRPRLNWLLLLLIHKFITDRL